MAKRASKLTVRQSAFVAAYIISLNATRAAKEAGYSEKTAKSQGQRLLTKVDVATAIEIAMIERSERTRIEADRVLQQLARIAFFDIGSAFGPGGTLKSLGEMDEETRGGLVCVVVRARLKEGVQTGAVIKINLADKLKAIELLMRHLGVFNDRSRSVEYQVAD